MERQRQRARALLQAQVGEADPAQVTSLVFTDVALLDEEELSGAKFPGLTELSMVAMKPPLKDFAFVASRFPALQKLVLSDNRIDAIPADFAMPNLVHLNLANNAVASTHTVAELGKGCPQLEVLDLFMNPAADDDQFSTVVFAAVPSLQVLNDHTADGKEVELDESDDDDEEDEEGSEEDEDEEEEGGDDGAADEGAAGEPPAAKQHRTEEA